MCPIVGDAAVSGRGRVVNISQRPTAGCDHGFPSRTRASPSHPRTRKADGTTVQRGDSGVVTVGGMDVQGADPDALLGQRGEQLGVGAISGATGWVVELDNHQNTSRGDPSADHVALVRLPAYQHEGVPAAVMDLEDGAPRELVVDFDLGHLVVTLEGAVVLETDVPDYVPFEGYLGVTAGTGSLAKRHILESWTVETGCW